MTLRRTLLSAALGGVLLPLAAQAQTVGQLAAPEAVQRGHADTFGDRMTGDLAAHDPSIIKANGVYYVFGTATTPDPDKHIAWRTSTDLIHWKEGGYLFNSIPQWAQDAVPGTKAMWAPDISYENGRYRLYYAVSTFGGNRSAIGLFTSPTLDPSAPGYGWRDEGLVVMSKETDDYNCIDPNLIVDRDGKQWLVFGSFWSGLKMRRIDPATGKLSTEDTRTYSVARRPEPTGGPDAIEAPFIIQRSGWYYLFASYDYCCKGVNSSYYVAVGRSRSVTGPYLGKDGRSMNDGGGTLVVRGDSRWRGPGHEAVLRDGDKDYLVYHTYDATRDGAPTLRLSPITWTADGWPEATL